MFLDTTRITDSTLSSPASPSTTTTGTTTGIDTGTNGISTQKEPLINEASDCQERSRRAVLLPPSHNQPAASSSKQFIQSILLESLLRIRRWLGASVGALWAALSFINHFIESKLIRGLLIPKRANLISLESVAAADRQLAWRETPMISFHNYHKQTHQQPQKTRSGTSSAIDAEYLSVVNRARKWSEEAAEVIRQCAGTNHECYNNNNSWPSHGSLSYSSHIYCGMELQHRGRVAQCAGSSSGDNHKPASGSLASPLALPLHSPKASYPDALQIRRLATTVPEVPITLDRNGNSTRAFMATEVRGLSGMCGGAQHQKQRTPTDFQGQDACCSLPSNSHGAPLPGEHEFARQKHHHEQQQRQRNDQTPLEQRLSFSRALFGMQKLKNNPEYGSCVVTQLDQDNSGSHPRSRPGREQNHFRYRDNLSGQRQPIDNSLSETDGASLVLVSKSTLSNLTEQIAFSMNKMQDLEDKVRVIPELQRRLHNVIGDTSPIATTISRSPNSGIRDSKYYHTNHDLDHVNNSVGNRIKDGNNFRRNSLNEDNEFPHRTMFSSSLRQPYGGSMRYSPGFRASNMNPRQSGADSAKASSFSISTPYTTGQRYFDKLVRSSNDCNHSANGNSRQSLDMSNALRSTHESLNGSNLAPSTKVEYEDLINDLISLSYSVNYRSSNSNSAHSQSSSGAGNHSQVKETHGNKLEAPDATRTSKTKRNIHSKSNSDKHVISTQPSNSNSTYHLHTSGINNNLHHDQNSTFNSSMNHLPYHPTTRGNNHSHQPISYLARNQNGSGSLSLQTTPVKTHLDCGCQSFKEHLRYNSMSREQRLNGAKSQQIISNVGSNNSSNNVSPQPPASQRMDAATNTDLSMEDIVSKSDLNKLVDDIRKAYSNISPPDIAQDEQSHGSVTRNVSTSPTSDSSSGSATGPNSSSQPESRSASSGDERFGEEEDASDDNVGMNTNSSASAKDISDDYDPRRDSAEISQDGCDNKKDEREEDGEDEEDEDEEIEVNLNSIDGAEEAYSLGSSYQDPSDFEEYCAYGESLDRRTKDFLSQTTKIPNDLRFALIRLNDFIKKRRPHNQIESSSNCIDVIRKEWFEVAASKDAQAIATKLYVDYFESFTKQLLNMVVNLTDTAGNTAMHYAASHFKLDIIEILLDTKVCDVNCRNKAGYTPIMLLALAELEDQNDQEVARLLFSMGDVNIKARSSGQTALMLAASHGRLATCKLLLECGADPSLRDHDGSTALMCGSELGNEDVVRCLLAHKLTDPNATDNDGLDALTIAMNNGHKGIGLILYAAKNVPRMTRSAIQSSNPRLIGSASSYLGASMRRSRGKSVMNHVRRADSLLGQRYARSTKQLEVDDV